MEAKDLTLEQAEEMARAAVDSLASKISEMNELVLEPTKHLQEFAELTPGPRMLDVGCGWGRYVERFVELGFEYLGIDLSPEMVRLCRTTHPLLRFEAMSFRKLDFPDESFDALWCCCSLGTEPKRNMQNVLAELRRVLVQDGLLYVMLPDIDEYGEQIVPIFDEGSPEALNVHWDPDEFREELSNAGFQYMTLERIFWMGTMVLTARK